MPSILWKNLFANVQPLQDRKYFLKLNLNNFFKILRLCHDKIIFFKGGVENTIIMACSFFGENIYAALSLRISGLARLYYIRVVRASQFTAESSYVKLFRSKVVVNLVSDCSAVAKENSTASGPAGVGESRRPTIPHTRHFYSSTTYHANRNEIFREQTRTWVRAVSRLGLLN